MTDNTANLKMPYILPSQAHKHVTHNEALPIADAVAQLAIVSRSVATPPAELEAGARYLVATGADGAWAGHDGKVAAFADESWAGTGTELDDLARLGVSTAADQTNRLAVKSDAALLSHDDVTPGSGDMRFSVNKAAAGNTA